MRSNGPCPRSRPGRRPGGVCGAISPSPKTARPLCTAGRYRRESDMITLTINGLDVSVEEGSTILEAAQFLGFPIPTLCHMEGLTPYGACRLCVVEIGEGPRRELVSSCTYPAEQGLKVRTASARVVRARKMIIELLLASCPAVQDHPGPGLEVRGEAAAVPTGIRRLHPLRPVRAHVRGADDGQGHRLPRARAEPEHRNAVRRALGSLPAVRRLHVRLSRPAAALHVHGAGEGHLRRLRQSQSAVPGEGTVRRHDVLHGPVRCL